MRLSILILSLMVFIISIGNVKAQTKEGTIEWINKQGEESLREITGNSSIYWELDMYGTLKITNYEPINIESKEIVKRFTYLNLYDLQLNKIFEESSSELILKCRMAKNNCIKTRNYFRDSNSTTYTYSSYTFSIRKDIDIEKRLKLTEEITYAISIFSGEAKIGE